MSGLYVHIPFCASRCVYCGFYSTTRHPLRDAYVRALCREMTLRRDFLPEGERVLRTIYIGGGTPSQLTADHFQKLFSAIHATFDCRCEETTVELNPDDVTTELAQTLRQLGADRVSMGAQTFDDSRLRFLRRRHTAEQVRQAAKTLRQAGFDNISLDLMFGFPGETADDWSRDIDAALALGVEHISAYSLMYEEGTPLFHMLEQGRVAEISDELSLQMYGMLTDRLEAAGYEHYEISNFALPHRRAQHNSSYWNDTPYLGIGAAAHSYNRQVRQWNVADVDAYTKALDADRLPTEETERIDPATHYDDLVTTALRTREGLCLSLLTPGQRAFLLDAARPHLRDGLLRQDANHLALTRRGIYLSDRIMSDLMMV